MASAYAVSAAIGIGVAIQVAIIGRSSGKIHPFAISAGLHLAGLLAGAVWVTWQRAWSDLTTVISQWWWAPIGALGFLLIGAAGFAANRIGVAATLSLIVISQLVVGLGVDINSGTVTIGIRPIAGVALLMAGLFLITAQA